MPTFIVFADCPATPLTIDHVTAADAQTAATLVRAALTNGRAGIGGSGRADVNVALVQADAAFVFTPPAS